MSKEKRFKKILSEGLGVNEIWVDTKTGVNYLYHSGGYGGGLTPLLDSNGKPIVSSVINE